ncbi:MAG: HlyD family efflux transporter periplasmic adaptor subunit, partial [Halioglobus sp.]
ITGILLLAVLTGVAAAGWYYWESRWYETTENAYLTGNLVQVSAQIGGTVVWIGREQNQRVQKGQEILRLSDGDELQLLALRKSELALAVQDVLTLRAEVNRLLAEQRLRVVTHDLAEDEFERRQRLVTKNMVSKEELDAAHTREAETRVAMETAQLALTKARVRAGTQELSEHPMVMVASARLRSAYRDWHKTRVMAPVDGEVARRRVQAGQRIAAGTPLFSIAERHSAWVEANFKETQLRHIRPGQPVEIHSDLYGNTLTLRGHVGSIGTGTGSVFSLLPPQNATGNWIKIVQRVPVRIELDEGFDRKLPLPFGASLHVRVNTRERDGPALRITESAEPVADADIYHYQDEGVDELIAQIIADSQG